MIREQFMILFKKLAKSFKKKQEKRWVTKIIKNNFHLSQNNKILKGLFLENSIRVVDKRKNNLKDLLLRSDSFNIKRDLLDNTKYGYRNCKKKFDCCNNFVDEATAIKCFATGRIFKIRRDSLYQTKNVIYVVYCLNCQKQGVGLTVS